MVISVVSAEELAPRSTDEFEVGGGLIDDDGLMNGAPGADGEAGEGASDR